MLDFVDPFRPVGNLDGFGRNAGFERGFGHMGYLGDARCRWHACPAQPLSECLLCPGERTSSGCLGMSESANRGCARVCALAGSRHWRVGLLILVGRGFQIGLVTWAAAWCFSIPQREGGSARAFSSWDKSQGPGGDVQQSAPTSEHRLFTSARMAKQAISTFKLCHGGGNGPVPPRA